MRYPLATTILITTSLCFGQFDCTKRAAQLTNRFGNLADALRTAEEFLHTLEENSRVIQTTKDARKQVLFMAQTLGAPKLQPPDLLNPAVQEPLLKIKRKNGEELFSKNFFKSLRQKQQQAAAQRTLAQEFDEILRKIQGRATPSRPSGELEDLL